MTDSLIEKSREVRDKLLKDFGGLDGLCDKLEDMDREREQAQTARKQSPGQTKSRSKSSRPLSAKRPKT
jgi:hypothetical protein